MCDFRDVAAVSGSVRHEVAVTYRDLAVDAKQGAVPGERDAGIRALCQRREVPRGLQRIPIEVRERNARERPCDSWSHCGPRKRGKLTRYRLLDRQPSPSYQARVPVTGA